ncbi:MAG TPA: hypothetical protein VFS95_14200 [Telluria sp.]|nr:hypothetical protein [Telluria sp.]
MQPFSLALLLCAPLAGAAQAQSAAAPWWSISAPPAGNARFPLALIRGAEHAEDSAAWTLAARYRWSAGTFQLGYATPARDVLPGARQWSIGYSWPLSRRTLWFADTVQPRWSGGRAVQIGIKSRD